MGTFAIFAACKKMQVAKRGAEVKTRTRQLITPAGKWGGQALKDKKICYSSFQIFLYLKKKKGGGGR